jgi:predicted esterase
VNPAGRGRRTTGDRRCGLVVALALSIAVGGAGPAAAQTARAFERAYQRGDWSAAATAAARWAESAPEDPTAAYNAACAHALAGDVEAALEWLRRAGEAGFAGLRSIEEDPDLATVRPHPGFADATATIRANRGRMFATFKAHAEQAEILTFLPPGAPAGPRPLIVVLHGYGDEPRFNAELYHKAARQRGAIVAAPSGLRPGPGGRGFSWTYRDEAEWWVLRAIEKLTESYPVDPERVVLAGFSQGANVALSVGLRHPHLFAGLLPVAGHYDADRLPLPQAGGPRVYLLTGARDPAVETFRTAAEELAGAALEVRLRVVPAVRHAYPRQATKELGQALDFLLP